MKSSSELVGIVMLDMISSRVLFAQSITSSRPFTLSVHLR